MTSATGVVTSVTTVGPFIPKPEKYTPLTAALAFFKEKAKDIAKSGSYLAFWATRAVPSLPPNVTKFNTTLRDFKNFIGATEIPEKLCTWGKSTNDLLFDKLAGKMTSGSHSWGEVGTSARKVFKDTMSLINSGADTIEFTHLFVPICKETLRWVSGINFAATLGFAGNGAIEQVQEINKMKEINTKKFGFHMINIARDVSYVVLGIIGLGFIITATPIVPWMIVACLTSGLTWTISSYFYEKMFDPENKGKNLNPAIVIENIANKKKHEQRLAQAATAIA
jgi:hypothetical protein